VKNNTLLERLDGINDNSVNKSIERNLNHIFITRQGSTLIRVDDYGIPDFNHYDSREKAIPEIIQSIKNNIREFEPRLKNIRIKYTPDDSSLLKLKFAINATIERDNAQITIVMTETGRIRVLG